MLALLLASSCVVAPPCPGCDELDCAAVVLQDGDDADPCDLAACTNCVDACGAECVVLESYPPQYSCGSASWDVYDECPAWEPPPTGEPHVDEIVSEGCGAEGPSLTATSTVPGRIDVIHDDYLLGCCPQSVEVEVTALSGTLSVEYTLVDDLCDCACMLDVSYAIVDVGSGPWTIECPQSGASTTVEVL